jgi:hypothetical protein
MWAQIVGKTRLALAPPQNTIEIEFDLLRHVLELRSSLGQTAAIALASGPVARFFRDYLEVLDALNIRARFLKRPVEVREAIPFDQDLKHRTYDPEWANSLWRVLVQTRNVFERFRGEFIGKASPVHFFWGAFARPTRPRRRRAMGPGRAGALLRHPAGLKKTADRGGRVRSSEAGRPCEATSCARTTP